MARENWSQICTRLRYDDVSILCPYILINALILFHSAFVLMLAVMAQVFKLLLKKFPSKGLNDDVAKDTSDKTSDSESV
jgi:hypothetical protein